MSELTLAVRLTADASGLTGGLRISREALDQLNRSAAGTKSGTTAAASGLDKMEREAAEAERRMRDLAKESNSLSASLKRFAGGVAAALGIRELIRWADGWKLVEGRLRLVTTSSANLAAVQDRLFALAQETRNAFGETADLYARMARSTKELGVSQSDLLVVTKAINQSLIVSGASADAANAALTQLGQGLASGALRGDELRSVLEQAPRLAEAIAMGMGKSVGELRKLGEDGKLTAATILDALKSQSGAIEAEFSKMPKTVGQALTYLGNAFQKFIGETDRASGLTAALAEAITWLGDNLKSVLVAGLTAASAAAVAGFGAMQAAAIGAFGRMTAAVTAFTAALARNPFGLLLVALTAVIGNLTIFKDEIQPVAGSIATLGDYMRVAFVEIQGWIAGAIDWLAGLAGMFAGTGETGSTVLRIVTDALGWVGDGVKFLGNLFINTFRAMWNMPGIVGRAIVDHFSAAFDQAAQLASTFWQGLEQVFEGDFSFTAFNKALEADVFANVKSGFAQMRDEFADIYEDDILGEFAGSIGAIGERWQRAAEEMAKGRLAAEQTASVLDDRLTPALKGTGAASEDIAKAREDLEELYQAVADLEAQQTALKGGGLEELRKVENLQGARDLLLKMGEAAKLQTKDIDALGRAFGVTVSKVTELIGQQTSLKEALEKTKDEIKQQEKLPAIYKEFVGGLETANQELRLSIKGQEDLVPLLQAEVDLRDKLGRELLPNEREELKKLSEEKTRLTKLKAQQEEYQKALTEPFKNAFEGIDRAFIDLFEGVAEKGMASFKDFGKSIKSLFIHLAAEIAQLLIFRPILGQIASSLGLGGIGSMLGSGTAQASSGGLLGSLFGGNGGGFDLGSLFGGGSGGGGGFIDRIGQSLGINGLGGILGGAGAGFGVGMLFNSILGGNSKIGTVGSGLGGLAGAAIGSIIPGVGTLIGGLVGGGLGGLLGKLFGKKKKKPKAAGYFSIGGGELALNRLTDKHGGDASVFSKNFGAVNDALQSLLGEFDLAIADGAISGSIKSKTKKKGTKYKAYIDGYGEVGGGKGDEGLQSALEGITVGSLKAAALKGALGGGGATETIKTVLKNSTATKADDLAEDLRFGNLYDTLTGLAPEVTEAEQAIKKLEKEFAAAKVKASEFGLSLEKLDEGLAKAKQKLRDDFNEGIGDAILAITDPVALALKKQAAIAADRLKEAQALGADLVEVERLNALEREQILKQSLQNFRRFVDEMLLGDLSILSPEKQFAQAQGRYQEVVAKADAGDATALAEFTEVAGAYLEIARENFASSSQYAAIFEAVLAKAKAFGNIPGFASGGIAKGWAVVGEKGPELAYFRAPTRIFDHQSSKAALQAANQNATGAGGGNAAVLALTVTEASEKQTQTLAALLQAANQRLERIEREFALERERRKYHSV